MYEYTVHAHSLGAHGWPKQAFASLVQFGEDDVLCLIGRRLSREVDHDWLVRLFRQMIQNEILPEAIYKRYTYIYVYTCTSHIHIHVYVHTCIYIHLKASPNVHVHVHVLVHCVGIPVYRQICRCLWVPQRDTASRASHTRP